VANARGHEIVSPGFSSELIQVQRMSDEGVHVLELSRINGPFGTIGAAAQMDSRVGIELAAIKAPQ
jgi:hypothetical protein